ncbi:hypothetical protein L1987_16666 [Smallanthus sonchifolius]|uniref:Uncharacterized protein n=1 Tax=Smallanthus sonchifolius TaxID=185202 RepID=A0ACB9IWS6_9ASTR|nr:hypothetical protein L1987_16666 [Smallanthus sonchifolius]
MDMLTWKREAIDVLRSLLPGTRIPTVSSENYLTITPPSFSDQVSINNVNIVGSPVFDDGSLIIFGIDDFFDPDFQISDAPAQIRSFNDCETSYRGDKNFSFHDAGNVLISRGYSVMASFLNLQLLGFLSRPSLTLFVPVDEVMVDYSGRFPDYPSLFLRHVLPCKISWKELANVDNRTKLNTVEKDSLFCIKSSATELGGAGDVSGENEETKSPEGSIPVAFPDMYYSDWLVIHGIPEALSLPEPAEEVDDSDTVPSGIAAKELTVPAASTRIEF